ncbi:hypothetical protein SAMN05444360_12353 [Chryseobacterium carnipullorum]|uniref:hypothetical protein n=1 Tax=Chryseobacterium carnipullorum TaxID=1124835 RepID=UPI00091D1B5A|nr:hypothetical protein [Chryseobacterium carnipullorum]SHM96132.1 hypothetical protein SAMN05444360_12353 [Chryseobacterium carnipullorum]
MILGVYWYFKFPENLYRFQFFTFINGMGGHADNLAGLEARVLVKQPENLLKKLEELHLRFKRIYLDLKINGNQLLISTGDYTLFDEHFQFVSEIEQLLILSHAHLTETPFEATSTRNFRPENKPYETIQHRFIQIIGSDFKKDNAENLSIRIDCNLPLSCKKDLINHLTLLCHEENIHVFYYYEKDFKSQCNLMLIFSNGRQMENAIQNVHIHSFGNKILQLTQKYPLHFGHFGGMDYYPLDGPFVQLIKDEEYILIKK